MPLTTMIIGTGREKKREFFLPYIVGKDVLDIGCAGGDVNRFDNDDWMHRHIKSFSQSCIGIDHNERVVDEANALGYIIIKGDAQDFHFDKKFDVVCAFDIIEHLQDLKGFFISVKKVLKNNGKLLISVPNPWFFMRFVKCFTKGDGGVIPDHVYWFCTGTIRELLQRYGFEVEKIEFGSGQRRLYHYVFLPKVIRHTSIFVICQKKYLTPFFGRIVKSLLTQRS